METKFTDAEIKVEGKELFKRTMWSWNAKHTYSKTTKINFLNSGIAECRERIKDGEATLQDFAMIDALKRFKRALRRRGETELLAAIK